MGFHFSFMLALFTLVFGGKSQGLQNSPELYWKTVLPNTPIPKAISDLLLHPNKAAINGARVGSVKAKSPPLPPYQPAQLPAITLPPILVLTTYAAATTKSTTQPNEALFFLKKTIQPGTKILNLNFIKKSTDYSNPSVSFLPRQQAQSIPFSSNKLPQILTRLSLKPNSVEAEMVKQTIKECENNEEDNKFCATSLEAMIDFVTADSRLGPNVEAISTEVEDGDDVMMNCTVTGVEKKKKRDSVACHKLRYPFAVFYCHVTKESEVYVVRLVGGDDGMSRAKAVVACHTDTSRWNPNHLAFQMLKVKPGTVPICHFLPEDHVVWIQN